MIQLGWRPKLLLIAEPLKHSQSDSASYCTHITLFAMENKIRKLEKKLTRNNTAVSCYGTVIKYAKFVQYIQQRPEFTKKTKTHRIAN